MVKFLFFLLVWTIFLEKAPLLAALNAQDQKKPVNAANPRSKKQELSILKKTTGATLQAQKQVKNSLSKKEEVRVPFSFERKSLLSIVEMLIGHKQALLIVPQGANLEVLRKQTVTFRPQGTNELPFHEAWNLMLTFLDLSRFALSEKKEKEYIIVPVGRPDEAGITREILPLFVNVPYTKLPKNDERIRYIYYLQNLKTPTQEDRETNPIARIFKDLLSSGSPVIYEPKSNGFIITDKSSMIISAMIIISELDKSGFKETIDIIDLHFVPATEVVKVFDMLRKAAGEAAQPAQPFIRGDARADSLGYFASDTKIIADNRQNRLIIMGRESAVGRISDFVAQYMDTPPESGKSILHYYDLQYLNAEQFAEVLSRIVTPPDQAGQQARAAAAVGPERYFQGVVVMAEKIKEVEAKATTKEITLEAKGNYQPVGLDKQTIKTGGNRLLVAAVQEDWEQLVPFIQSVDKPERQVILEVLIVDIISTKSRIIAGTTRGRNDCNSLDGVEFLSSNISPVNNVLGASPTQLNQDLLRVLSPNDQGTIPLTNLLAQGSLIISINDPSTPGISSLIQVLDSVVQSKVLSHPYLVSTNNQIATIASQEIRRVQGDAVPGAAGVVTIEIIDLAATLQVQMVPRISSPNRLSLQVAVDINEFVTANSNTRTTRRVNTNANMGSGQVLVIGGLTRVDQADQVLGTPFLNRIPLINVFFGNRTKTVSRTNLAILISPTIIEPKLRGGVDVYTTDKIKKSRRDIDDSVVFGDRRDPITRFFFNVGEESEGLLREYLSEVKNKPDEEFIKTKKERIRERERQKRARPQKKEPAKPGVVREVPA